MGRRLLTICNHILGFETMRVMFFIQKINNKITFEITVYCGPQNKQPGLVLHTYKSECPWRALQPGVCFTATTVPVLTLVGCGAPDLNVDFLCPKQQWEDRPLSFLLRRTSSTKVLGLGSTVH